MTDRIVCRRCGTANAPDDTFCGSCGAYLAWEGDSVDAPREASSEPASPMVAASTPDTVASAPDTATAGAIHCRVCGTSNPGGRTFCQSCGERLAAAAAPTSARAASPSGTSSGGTAARPPAPQPSRAPVRSHGGTDPSSGGLPGWLLPVAGLGLLVGLVVVGASILLGGDGGAASEATSAPGPPSPTLTPTLAPSGGSTPSQDESVALLPIGASSSSVRDDDAAVDADMAIDGRLDTSWQEGADGAVGEWIEVSFEAADLDFVVIYSGDQASADAFRGLLRPKDVLVSVDGGPPAAFLLADSQQPQRLDLELSEGPTTVRIEIASTYEAQPTDLPGSPLDVAAISEIRLFGRPGG